jgi:hypothetical protein
MAASHHNGPAGTRSRKSACKDTDLSQELADIHIALEGIQSVVDEVITSLRAKFAHTDITNVLQRQASVPLTRVTARLGKLPAVSHGTASS